MSEYAKSNAVKHILFCHCGGDRIPTDLLNRVDEYLKELAVEVTRMSDLCGLVAHKKEELSKLIHADDDFLVIGCFHRTMKLLLEQIKKDNAKPFVFSHINLIDASIDEVMQQTDQFCGDHQGKAIHCEITEDSGWPSWYPVIDYNRCTACGQCADFCLFGVYEKSENGVHVINPEGCKNNCPACGRICPVTAIIFPKYTNGGAIGGSDDIDEQAELQRQAQDIESLLGEDLYAALEKRKQRRKSIIQEEAMKKALNERENALNHLQ